MGPLKTKLTEGLDTLGPKSVLAFLRLSVLSDQLPHMNLKTRNSDGRDQERVSPRGHKVKLH